MLPRLLLRDPNDWTLDQVSQLIQEQIPEGQRMEYKAALVLETKSQKVEAAKDISGLANAQGGWVIFGVSEDDSPEPLPVELSPLPATALQTRLEDILDSACEPIPDYQAATIPAGDGVILIVRVSKATGRPVMVQGYEQNRYFVRAGTRTRPMNATEVADAHTAANQRETKTNQRLADLPLRSNIAQVKRMYLPTSPELPWLPYVSVVVAAIDGRSELIARNRIAQDGFAESNEGYRGQQRTVRSGQRWAINTFGLIDELSDPPPPREQGLVISVGSPIAPDDERLMHHRVAIYRAGVVEWAHRYPDDFGIPSRSLADEVHNALLYAAQVFDGVGFGGSLKVWVRIENAESAQLLLARDADLNVLSPGVDVLEYTTEVGIGNLLLNPTPITRNAMDALWQGFGLERCMLFDGDGNWRTER